MKKIVVGEMWPAAISDGLLLPCSCCGLLPHFDYHVDDGFWSLVVPPAFQRDVVCLFCLDKLATSIGADLADHLRDVQFTGVGKTIVLLPVRAYYYEPPPYRSSQSVDQPIQIEEGLQGS